MEDLKIAIEEPRSWARRLTITVPAERVAEERRAVTSQLAKRIRLPGFRKGRIPSNVVERKYGATIDQQTLERVVGSAYREALEQKGFEPINQAEVGDVDWQPGADLTFRVDFEVRPTLELGRTGGFTVEKPVPEVSEAEVDRVVERLREDQATWRALAEDESARDGDRVRVEITPLRTEDEDTPEPRAYEVVLGRQEVLPEIEDMLREMKPGEERERPVHVHRHVEGTEEGEEVDEDVRVRLVEGMRPELPEADDEFARSLGDFADFETLRARVQEDLVKEAEQEAERAVRRELMDHVLEANPFDVPASMVDHYLEGLLPAGEGADAGRLAEARQATRPAAERALKRMLVIEHLADREDLRATEDDVVARVTEIAERNDASADQVRARLRRAGRLQQLEDEITEDKVFDYLKSQSTIE